jgi:hypothetical protein
MKTSYTKLIEAMTQKDWQSANERFADIMEQKVSQRLAQEKRGLHEAFRYKSQRVSGTFDYAIIDTNTGKQVGFFAARDDESDGVDTAAVRANRRTAEMNRNAAGVKEACGTVKEAWSGGKVKDADSFRKIVQNHPKLKSYWVGDPHGDMYAGIARDIPFTLLQSTIGMTESDIKVLEHMKQDWEEAAIANISVDWRQRTVTLICDPESL